MSYTIEKSAGGQDLVISGFDKGIASSPYLGIASMMGVNTTYYPGVSYVNYKRSASTITGIWYAGTHSTNVSNNTGWIFNTSSTSTSMGLPVAKAVSPAGLIYILDDTGVVFKQDSVNGSSFTQLGRGNPGTASGTGTGRRGNGNKGLAYWNNYLVVIGDGYIEFCGDGTGDSTITTANWNYKPTGYFSCNFTTNFASSNSLVKTSGTGANGILGENYAITLSSTGILPAPLVPNTTYYVKTLTTADTFDVSLTAGGSSITLLSNGTGTHTCTINTSFPLPLGNITAFVFSFANGSSGVGATSLTITSYVNPRGETVSGTWYESSGQYAIIDPLGNELLAEFTFGSGTVTLLLPTVIFQAGTYSVKLINTSATTNKTYVSKADGNLYFANNRNAGRILAQNGNANFVAGFTPTYTVAYSAVAVLQPSDSVVDMVDLKSNMVIAGQKDVYTWDYVSPTTSAPSPVPELIKKITNDLNNIYILAGNKGNIYISNGYSAQNFFKIPDYIAGVIDPVWLYGDIMVHRAKIFFQAVAQTTAGVNILGGIFSLNVSPTNTSDVSLGNVLVMENQNSYGLTPASGATGAGILADNTFTSPGYDSYYSAWSNGASTGGIDYNDTTPWSNYEPTIETEIIPIGDILTKRTLGLLEFKLDRPLVTGDALRIYARTSLSDSYALLGTTTTTQLSDYYQTNIFQQQWIQFKVQFKCVASGSSFIPFRELRLHTQ